MKTWKMAAAGGAIAAGTVYGGSLVAFLMFFRRERREGKCEERLKQLLERSPYAEWMPKIDAAKGWLELLECEEIGIKSRDGLRLHAQYYENPKPNGRTVVFCHGYKSNCFHNFNVILPFYWEKGYHMLLIDQRAHGKSEGTYICFGAKEQYDVAEWCRLLVKRGGHETKYILHGMSMGATVALLAAGLPEVKEHLLGVVADSGFTSPYEQIVHVAKDYLHVPGCVLPVLEGICRHRAGFRFHDASTEASVRKISAPVLLIHGEADDFVPAENSRKVYRACTAACKQLILVPEAGHGMSYFGDAPRCAKALEQFLGELEK